MLSFAMIASVYHPDAEEHRRAAESIGLVCPVDVFEQLLHETHAEPLFAATVRKIDWLNVRWREAELTGAVLVEVQIPRDYEHAVVEARAAVQTDGLQDERSEVVSHWRGHGSWFRSPILVTGEVADLPIAYEMLVGFTRLGNLRRLMDRGELPAPKRHRVWIGAAFMPTT